MILIGQNPLFHALNVNGITASWGSNWGSDWGLATPSPTVEGPYAIRVWDTATTFDYPSEPNLVQLNNGNVACVYRVGSNHAGGASFLAIKETSDPTNWNVTERVVADDPSFDDRNQQVAYNATTGEMCVQYRTYNGSTTQGVYRINSNDAFATASTRVDIGTLVAPMGDAVPYGPAFVNSRGITQLWYNTNNAYKLLSATGDLTNWAYDGSVYLSQSGVFEPYPVVFDDATVYASCRTTGNVFPVFRSTDGGAAWSRVTDITLDSSHSFGAPPALSLDNTGNVVFVDTPRGSRLCRYRKPERSAWRNNPTTATNNLPSTTLASLNSGGSDSDVGYASTLLLSNKRDMAVAYYAINPSGGTKCEMVIIRNV